MFILLLLLVRIWTIWNKTTHYYADKIESISFLCQCHREVITELDCNCTMMALVIVRLMFGTKIDGFHYIDSFSHCIWKESTPKDHGKKVIEFIEW